MFQTNPQTNPQKSTTEDTKILKKLKHIRFLCFLNQKRELHLRRFETQAIRSWDVALLAFFLLGTGAPWTGR